MVGYKKATDNIKAAGPLELNLSRLIDTEKGCYLGQEAVSAQTNNPRGPPRKLYSVVFPDDNDVDDDIDDDEEDDFIVFDDNNMDELFEEEEEEEAAAIKPGDKLYLLGSNETVQVGYITSVAETGSTGEATTVALALVKRSETILKQQAELGLVTEDFWVVEEGIIDDGNNSNINNDEDDPLHHLEVVIQGKWKHGRLHAIHTPLGCIETAFELEKEKEEDKKNMIIQKDDDNDYNSNSSSNTNENNEANDDDDDEEEEAKAQQQKQKQQKAKKLELLRQRAEEAMQARKQKRENI